MNPDFVAPGIGSPAPDFDLVSGSGSRVTLAAFRNYRHVVIHFVREFT
ncbi:MAG: hypothetical protein ACE5JR_00735 [Gemmatimonadota bacterium]